MRKITLAVCAHVDAGKTTFSEHLLYHGGRLRSIGAVDAGNTSLDHHEIEKQRGITVFADQSGFETDDLFVYLLDTPGHTDFSAEMERALQTADVALLLISAVEGVQGHTRTVWQLLKELGTPTFFFINKTDRVGADVDAVKAQIDKLTGLPQIDGIGILRVGDAFKETLASESEELMDAFFLGEGEDAFWRDAAAKLFAAGRILPVFSGSALQDIGVKEWMDALPHWVEYDPGKREELPFAAKIYRLTRDKAGQRWYHIKIESGSLAARDSIQTAIGAQKVAEIRQCFGAKLQSVPTAKAGDLAAICGISAKVGDVLGDANYLTRKPSGYRMTALMKTAVEYDASFAMQQVLKDFTELAEEEPSLQVEYAAQTGEISVCTMGKVQLEVLQAIAEERFGYPVSFGECTPIYRETILAPVHGCGHYEPLRHYAEVHLRLSPLPRGSGIVYESGCSVDELGKNDQNLILTMLEETDKLGVLTGAPLTDVKITLLAGGTHLKHTEGGDLKQAACRALRQGLMKAESQLLEPWCSFTVTVPTALLGRVITDFTAMGASLLAPEMEDSGEYSVISGRAAAALLFDYPQQLAAFSGGLGSMQMMFDRYEPCGDKRQKQAIAAANYDPVADLEHSPDSIFCSHGAGFLVHWQDADEYMHIRLE